MNMWYLEGGPKVICRNNIPWGGNLVICEITIWLPYKILFAFRFDGDNKSTIAAIYVKFGAEVYCYNTVWYTTYTLYINCDKPGDCAVGNSTLYRTN
jgi:hypothetical protein